MMSLNEKISVQFEKFSVKAPDQARHLEHLYADYIELIALFSNSSYVTSADIIDRLKDEGVIKELEEEESFEIGSRASESNDEAEAWINEIFRVIEERSTLFGHDYPFSFEPNKIILKDSLTYKCQLYLVLLISSNLNLFNKVKTELTVDFEIISYYVLKNFLPSHAIVKQFGKNSDYSGTAKEKIKALAADLKVSVDEYELNNISDGNSQERGLDVIGWIPFGDCCPNMITILGQCACGKEWYMKQHDTSRYIHYLQFHRSIPQEAMFIPYAVINYSANKFYRSDDVRQGTLLFERRRIVEYFENADVFDSLESKKIVDKCIEYVEDIV